jgi:hypothetical protein
MVVSWPRADIECRIDLHDARNTLYEASDQGPYKDHDSYPESPPLHTVASIVPPLGDSLWRSLIEDLFQDHQAVMPVFEVLQLSIVGREVAA